jgi:PhnB protein
VPEGTEVPPGSPDLIIHAALTLDGSLLMASDDPTGDGGPTKGISVSYVAKDVGEVKRVFDALADGGQVTAPLAETFFSPSFGMCVDRFGIAWMVNAEAAETS